MSHLEENMPDPIDRCSARLAQAQAVAFNTYGQAFESFNGMNDEAKDNYLWALHELIIDAHLALKEFLKLEQGKASEVSR
jgi:hypothetical protein